MVKEHVQQEPAGGSLEGFFINGNIDAIINPPNGLKPVALDNSLELLWKGKGCKVIRFTRVLQIKEMVSVGPVVIAASLEMLFVLDGC